MRKNAGLDTDDQAQEVIRKKDEVIVVNDDDDDVIPGVFVKDGPFDRFSVSRKKTGQEMVNLDKINEISDKGESLGRGKRNKSNLGYYSPRK